MRKPKSFQMTLTITLKVLTGLQFNNKGSLFLNHDSAEIKMQTEIRIAQTSIELKQILEISARASTYLKVKEMKGLA